jgi:hypothetical protein
MKWVMAGVIFFLLSSYSRWAPKQHTPYKQMRIPLDVQKGIPFMKGDEGLRIHGFDVDSNENLYFIGNQEAVLACFSKDGRLIYRKPILNHSPGPIHIVGRELYLFETWNGGLNRIIQMDRTTGAIQQEYSNTITKALKSAGYKSIYDYQFSDSGLQLTYLDSEGIDKMKTICFNLTGQLMPHCARPADGSEHLGRFGNDYVLGKFDGENYDLSLRNSADKEISTAYVVLKYLGEPLCGFSCMPQEHRKIRNSKLYMLGRDKNLLLITEVDLAAAFHIH